MKEAWKSFHEEEEGENKGRIERWKDIESLTRKVGRKWRYSWTNSEDSIKPHSTLHYTNKRTKLKQSDYLESAPSHPLCFPFLVLFLQLSILQLSCLELPASALPASSQDPYPKPTKSETLGARSNNLPLLSFFFLLFLLGKLSGRFACALKTTTLIQTIILSYSISLCSPVSIQRIQTPYKAKWNGTQQ